MRDFLNTLNTTERACFVGGALGDALGFLVELEDVVDIQTFANALRQHGPEPFPDFILDYTPQCWLSLKKYISGQVSDDTQTSVILQQTLHDVGLTDLNVAFIKNLQQAFLKNRIISYGTTTKNALLYPHLPAESFVSTSNGSVMRIAPLGVYMRYELDAICDIAMEHSRVSHPHPTCQFACAAHSIAVALACQQPALLTLDDKQSFIKKIAEKLPKNNDLNDYLNVLACLLTAPNDAEKNMLAFDRSLKGRMQNEGLSMHALSTLIWAHFCFLNTPKNYWDSMCCSLHIGGDVDTVASICGSLSGVYNGMEGLPLWATDWVKNNP